MLSEHRPATRCSGDGHERPQALSPCTTPSCPSCHPCPPALLQITQRSIYRVYVPTRCPAGPVHSHLWGSRGGLAVGCAYRLAFVFLFISRLVCLGGCFSPNTRREKIQSALKVSTQSRRRLCVDRAWSSETPCWGVTPVSCEGEDLSRHPSGPWRCPGECPGLLCWPQDPGHKTGLGGGVGAPHLCLQHLKAEEVGPHPVQVPGDLGSAGWPLSSQDAQGLATRGRRAAPTTGQPGGIPSAGRLRDGGGSLFLSP